MIKRFDHAVIAVRDLEGAIERYRELGFDVGVGGRHTGRGTHNAVVRFGLDYLELISIYDEVEVATQGLRGELLRSFLRQHEGGCLGYCLASSNLDEDALRFERAGLPVTGPFAMQRVRPDGNILKWRLLVVGHAAWRRTWPSLIEWEQTDECRLSWDEPGRHANGASAIARVTIAAKSLAQAQDLYVTQLGLESISKPESRSELSARRLRFRVGQVEIDLLEPTNPGPLSSSIEADGEGLFEIVLRTSSLDQAATAIGSSAQEIKTDQGPALSIRRKDALGARLTLVA